MVGLSRRQTGFGLGAGGPLVLTIMIVGFVGYLAASSGVGTRGVT